MYPDPATSASTCDSAPVQNKNRPVELVRLCTRAALRATLKRPHVKLYRTHLYIISTFSPGLVMLLARTPRSCTLRKCSSPICVRTSRRRASSHFRSCAIAHADPNGQSWDAADWGPQQDDDSGSYPDISLLTAAERVCTEAAKLYRSLCAWVHFCLDLVP